MRNYNKTNREYNIGSVSSTSRAGKIIQSIDPKSNYQLRNHLFVYYRENVFIYSIELYHVNNWQTCIYLYYVVSEYLNLILLYIIRLRYKAE